MAFAAAARPTQVATINVTPLVDVLLVLLVIFMIATPLLTKTLVLDVGASPPPPLSIEPRTLRLQVGADGGVVLDGQPQAPWLLAAALQSAHDADPQLSLLVDASAEAPYERVAVVLALARSAGIQAISVESP